MWTGDNHTSAEHIVAWLLVWLFTQPHKGSSRILTVGWWSDPFGGRVCGMGGYICLLSAPAWWQISVLCSPASTCSQAGRLNIPRWCSLWVLQWCPSLGGSSTSGMYQTKVSCMVWCSLNLEISRCLSVLLGRLLLFWFAVSFLSQGASWWFILRVHAGTDF